MRDRFYTFIHVFGLTIGISGCLFVFLYVWNELSYDKFHHQSEQVFHVALTGKIADQEVETSTTCPPVGPAMISTIPGIEEMVRFDPTGSLVMRREEMVFAEKDVAWADSNFFTFFDFPLLKGIPSQVLIEPNSIVLSNSLAKKYFGEEDPIGQMMEVGNDKVAYKVTGVVENVPSNSHLQFNAILSMSSLYSTQKEYLQGWTNNSLQTYVRKNPSTSVAEVNKQLEGLILEHVAPLLEQFLGVDFSKFLENGGKYGYWIYPMSEIHLNSSLDHYPTPQSNISYIYIFGAVGLFLLVIACINFMNLSTAKSAKRAKEVGLRKTLGSQKGQMIGQFLVESIAYSMIATLFSFFIVLLFIPQFSSLSGVNLTMAPILTPQFILFSIGLALIVGLAAGSYPAFYLTSFSIVEVLKGKVRTSMKSGKVRSGLVVFQFIISIALITCTLVVYQQLQYIQNKNLGFDKEHTLVIKNTNRLNTNRIPFKNKLDQLPNIIATSYTNNVFPGVNNTTVLKEAKNKTDFLTGLYYSDWDHADAMGFEMAEGRFFDRNMPSDTLAAVVNESAVAHLGWTDPLSEELISYNGPEPVNFKIIGVIKDFNFESLKDAVRPLVIMLDKEDNQLMVRYSGSSKDVISDLESNWKDISGGEAFEYTFIDQQYDALFKEEQRMGKLFAVLSTLAIFVACLGLFALAAFMAEQRVKEIGIRKAMGASSIIITRLLTSEFVVLMLVAFVIAIYPSYYFMNAWLSEFSYRIELSWTVFAISGLISFLVAGITVGFQAFKATLSNPVDSLRYE